MTNSFDQLFKQIQPSPAALWSWDNGADCMRYCSSHYAEILEMTAPEALARFSSREALHLLIHPDDRARYKQAVDSKEPGEGLNIEYRIVTAAGNVKNISHMGMTVFDEQGKSLGVYITSQDITETSRHREQISHELLLSRQAERLTGVGYYEWDYQQECLLSCSEQYAALHGMDVAEAVANLNSVAAYAACIHPDDRERYFEAHANTKKSTKNLDIQFRIQNKDGRVRHVRKIDESLRDKDGNPVRSYGAMQDITELVNLQEQLRQAQKLEVVGQLTGGIAHDFNNLIAIILGNAELMQMAMDNDQAENPKLKSIVSAAERGAKLTQHLLAFSRKQSLHPKTLQLNKHLSNMLGLLERTLGKRIHLDIQHEEQLWPCYADQGQTENALLNLAINARDAMSNKGVLTVRTRNVNLSESDPLVPGELEAGKYVALEIEDDGIGMNDEVLSHVLEPFYTTKELGKGSGLGLSMVYGFAKQSSGHLEIRSELNKGTSVTLYLPTSKSTALIDEKATPISVEKANGTIVLVEDDKEILELVTAQLEGVGYEILQASDSSSALDTIKNTKHIDLLLTDVIIPGEFNGHQLALKALELKPETKILYMSGYTENSLLEDSNIELGVNMLSKPFRREQLVNMVSRILKSNSDLH